MKVARRTGPRAALAAISLAVAAALSSVQSAAQSTVQAAAQSPAPLGWRLDCAAGPGGGGAFATIGASASGLVVAASDLSGAYLSRDRGDTWEVLGAQRGLLTTHVAGIGFHPTDGDVFFLGGEDGIYRSEDGGQSVTHVLTSGYVEDIWIAPSSPAVGYAAWHPAYDSTAGGVFKTTDGGASWARVDLDLPSGLRGLEVLTAPDSAATVYLLSGEARFASGLPRVYRSTDGGAHWARIGAQFGDLVIDVATDPFDAKVLWASVDDAQPDQPGHLWRSSDRGLTWTERARRGGVIWPDTNAPQTIRMVDPRYQFVWDPREGIWESTDGGASFTRVSSRSTWEAAWSGAYFAILGSYSGPSLTLGTDLSDGDNLYWVNSQFVFGSFDSGRSLRSLFARPVGASAWASRGFDNIVPVEVAQSAVDPDEVYLACLDIGLWRSLDGGRSWSSCNQPAYTGGWAGEGGNTLTVLVDPTVAGTVWAPQAGSWEGPATLLESTDSGASWSAVGAGLPAAPLLGLSLDSTSPAGQRTLFVCAEGDVYRSLDGGASFARVQTSGGLTTTASDSGAGQVVYAGGAAGLWRSLSGGVPGSWQEVGLPEFRGPAGREVWDDDFIGVHDICPDPHVPGRVYVSVLGPGRGHYVSADLGATWQRLLADDFARSLAVSAHDPRVLFAGSSSAFLAGGYDPASKGLLISRDAGQTWSSPPSALAYPFVNCVLSDPTTPFAFLLTSPGQGFHRGRAAR